MNVLLLVSEGSFEEAAAKALHPLGSGSPLAGAGVTNETLWKTAREDLPAIIEPLRKPLSAP